MRRTSFLQEWNNAKLVSKPKILRRTFFGLRIILRCIWTSILAAKNLQILNCRIGSREGCAGLVPGRRGCTSLAKRHVKQFRHCKRREFCFAKRYTRRTGMEAKAETRSSPTAASFEKLAADTPKNKKRIYRKCGCLKLVVWFWRQKKFAITFLFFAKTCLLNLPAAHKLLTQVNVHFWKTAIFRKCKLSRKFHFL